MSDNGCEIGDYSLKTISQTIQFRAGEEVRPQR